MTVLSPKEMVPSHLTPYSGEAERRLIGALLLYRDRIGDVIQEINADDIFLMQHRWIYEAICTLYIDGYAINVETVSEFLKNKPNGEGKSRFESIGADLIIECMSGVESEEFEYWIEIIKQKSHERKLLQFIDKAKEMLFTGDVPVKEIQNKLEENLTSIIPDSKTNAVSIENSVDSIDEILNRYYEDPEGIAGFSTGFPKLDELLDGVREGNVYIFYAQSSRFKSLTVTNIGYNFAKQNVPGLWFTTEMPRNQVIERLLQIEIGYNIKKLRKDGKFKINYEAIKSHKAALAGLPIYFCDVSSPEINQIRADVYRFKRWHDIKYIIVDLVDHVYSNRFKNEMINNQRVVMAQMKALAKDFNVAVILVSHISKQLKEDRKTVDLDVESMIGSGAKYQDVDAAISISPWEIETSPGGMSRTVAMSRETLAWHMATYTDIPLLLAVTKNRHGPLGMVYMSIQMANGGKVVESLDKRQHH